jgi:hypothetical protein
MVFLLFFSLGFREFCLVYQHTLDFSHRVFPKLPDFTDGQITVLIQDQLIKGEC